MKILKIIMIFIIVITISTKIYAIEGILSTGEDWTNTGHDKATITMKTETLNEASGKLFNILFAGAMVVAVVVGAILGIQYMTAGISKKVEVKESLYPFVISCIVVFGSFGIWRLVVLLMSKI